MEALENMSYKEKNIAVSLFSTLLIFGFYLLRMYHLSQSGDISPQESYSLWGIIIVSGIIVNIASTIITYIVFSIINSVITGEEYEEPDVEDERDKLIELKGMRNSMWVVMIGIVIATGTQVFGMSSLVMFHLLLFFSILAALIGDISQLFYYQRGV